MGTRRGQALTELAFGMFAFALVVSALTTFAVYIARSLRVQNSARGPAPERAEPVETGAFAAEWLFGTGRLKIEERAVMPATTILK